MKKDRRRFIKGSVAGLAGAVMLNSRGFAEEDQAAAEKKPKVKRPMIYRTLGRTRIKLPIISMGAQAQNENLYSAALDEGITHIDTANNYTRGNHEKMVGNAIKGRPRESLVIGTKIYEKMDQKTGMFPAGTTADGLFKKFDESLERLGVDYVDILYLHALAKAEAVTYKPILDAILKLKKEGKARWLGVSTHTNEPEVIRACVDCKAYDVVLTSYNFKQPHVHEVKDAIAYAAGAGLGIMAMKTQAGVYLDAERKQMINMKAAIKWVLSDTNVHTAIPGFTSFDQMEMFLSVMEDLTLTTEEKADLNAAQKQAGLFCRQCGSCLSQCGRGIDIPRMMRAYMYTYGYKNLAKAKETISGMDLSSLACQSCETCGVTCPSGFDVRSRVRNIARLKDVPEEFVSA